MKSAPKFVLSDKDGRQWHPWFAWRPVKVYVHPVDAQNEQDYMWRRVWLEELEFTFHRGSLDVGPSRILTYRLKSNEE